jgi:hypothetical protein
MNTYQYNNTFHEIQVPCLTDLLSSLDAYLALAMLFGGVCKENALASLQEIRFEDLYPALEAPLSLPNDDRKRFACFR